MLAASNGKLARAEHVEGPWEFVSELSSSVGLYALEDRVVLADLGTGAVSWSFDDKLTFEFAGQAAPFGSYDVALDKLIELNGALVGPADVGIQASCDFGATWTATELPFGEFGVAELAEDDEGFWAVSRQRIFRMTIAE